MTLRRIAWIIAGAVVVIASVASLRLIGANPDATPIVVAETAAQRAAPPPGDGDLRSLDLPAASATAPASVKAARATAGTPPPDPATAPVIDRIRYWRSRMFAGDRDAACRLVVATRGCSVRAGLYAPWARARLATTGIGTDCTGVSDTDTNGGFETLLASAQQGHIASALLFAHGAGFSSLPVASPQELRGFKAHASRLAWQAFDAGDSDAAVLLWRAYNRVDVEALPLAGAIDPDPVKAHALDLLLDDLLPEFLVGTAKEAGLSAEQARQARELHAQWRSSAFAQRKPPRYGLLLENMSASDPRALDPCATAAD